MSVNIAFSIFLIVIQKNQLTLKNETNHVNDDWDEKRKLKNLHFEQEKKTFARIFQSHKKEKHTIRDEKMKMKCHERREKV